MASPWVPGAHASSNIKSTTVPEAVAAAPTAGPPRSSTVDSTSNTPRVASASIVDATPSAAGKPHASA